jgi:acetyl/propionyl-CoA carboxylase alpha subunit
MIIVVQNSHHGEMLTVYQECSIQRRYQKIVELAPSTISDRSVVAPVISSAVAMAQKVNSTQARLGKSC